MCLRGEACWLLFYFQRGRHGHRTRLPDAYRWHSSGQRTRNEVVYFISCGALQWCARCRPLALAGVRTACRLQYKALRYTYCLAVEYRLVLRCVARNLNRAALSRCDFLPCSCGKRIFCSSITQPAKAVDVLLFDHGTASAHHGVETGRHAIRAGSSSNLPCLARMHAGGSLNATCMFASLSWFAEMPLVETVQIKLPHGQASLGGQLCWAVQGRAADITESRGSSSRRTLDRQSCCT